MKKNKILTYLILFVLLILSSFSVKTFAGTNYKAKTYIDSPTEKMIVNDELEIEGWVMTDDEQSIIKVYIDGEEQEIQNLQRKEREDVLKAITGYGTSIQNPKPGYIMKIDCSKFLEGEHKIEVKIFSRDGEIIAVDSRNINLEKYVAKTYIDMPNNEKEYLIKDELNVEGWVMSNDEKIQIKAYMNGEEQEIQNLQRKEREDVLKAIKGYGEAEQNQTPGYILKIDTSKLTSGTYNLEIKIFSRTGEMLTSEIKKVVIQRYTSKSYIDSPIYNEKIKPDFTVSGWLMTDDENSQINVYLDDKKQTIKQITRKERTDVINAISGYGGINKNPEPGLDIEIENSNISDGIHTLKIENVSREGKVISTSAVNINYENYRTKTCIDEITYNNEIMNIEGWIMTEDVNTKVKIYIDGKEQQIQTINRKERIDVINAIHGYGEIEKNPKPGYNIKIDISNIKDGEHILKLETVSANGQVTTTREKKIEIDKYGAREYIDIPTVMGQVKNTLFVSGWVMSTDENAQIKIYINNEEQQLTEFKRTERPDVLKSIAGYGGVEKNPKPGYEASIDVSKYEDGKYTLRVDVISREGEKMCSLGQSIVIYNNYGFGIDVSKHNGTINWAQVKQEGVDFAIIRAGNRGYGESGNLVEDPKFVENMKGAISNGIKVGVYIYSQAITEAEAIEEADLAVRLIRDNGFSNNISLPIVIDTEASGGRADSLSRESRTAIVKAFCERIKQYGYTPMIYSNKWWLETKLDMNQLSSYELWLSHYKQTDDPANNPSDYKGNHQIWQYSDSGKINGILTNVDLNISYKKYF